MVNKRNKKGMLSNIHLRYIIATMMLCSFVYYLPVISGWAGWTSLEQNLDNLHNLYGIDFLGLDIPIRIFAQLHRPPAGTVG